MSVNPTESSDPKNPTGPTGTTGPTAPNHKDRQDDIGSIPVPTIHVWPEAYWRSYYYTAKMYPEQPSKEEQDACVDFFTSQLHLLPCHNCRMHFKDHISGLQKAKLSQKNLFEWLFSVQNDINERKGTHVYSWDESIQAVKRMCRGMGKYSPSESRPSGLPVWSIVLVCLLAVAIGVGIGVASAKARRKK